MGKMEEYAKTLIEQFMRARGIKKPDFNSMEFVNDFRNWLHNYNNQSGYYLAVLDCKNDGPTYGSNSVEIGKGKLDTMANGKDAQIITKYTDGIKSNGEIIKGEFSARGFGHGPVVLTNGRLNPIDKNITRFVTHNPYSASEIRNWERLYYSGKDISIGVFGNNDDKDIDEKLKMMKDLRDKLVGGQFEEEKYYIDYAYYYTLTTKNNVKTLKKNNF